MDLSDNQEFRNRLVMLAEVFDVKLSPGRQVLYFEALRDIPLTEVIRALNQAVKSCKFFPRPAELRTFALGDSEDRTEAAWMLLRKALSAVGSYASVSIHDAALGEAILALWGSWPAACATELTPEMWAAKRKEFGRVYRVLVDRQLDGARYLQGMCEQQNAGRPEWNRFVPVHRIAGDTITPLSLEAADEERLMIAAVRSGLTQLNAVIPAGLQLLPKSMNEAG